MYGTSGGAVRLGVGRSAAVVALALGVLLAAGTCGAATIYVDAAAAPGGDGSVGTPYQHVQDGINAAAVSGDAVVVAAGTYFEHIDFKGKALTVRSTDPLTASVVAATVLDGGSAGSVVTFKSGEGVSAILDGFTVTHGNSTDGWLTSGGVACRDGTPTIRHNVIVSNQGLCGGGVSLTYSKPMSATAEVQDNTISQNTATSSARGGGGVYCYLNSALATDQATVEISGNLIESNSAMNVGAQGSGGGGIMTYQLKGSLSVNMHDNVIRNNQTPGGGGGICASYGVSTVIEGNEISDNSTGSGSGGGGISCWATAATISNNTITGNSSGITGGGGIGVSANTLLIENNTISANTTKGAGGGIYCTRPSSGTINQAVISGNRITGNQTLGGGSLNTGGGVSVWDIPVLFENNVVANNVSFAGGGGVALTEGTNTEALVVHSNTIVGNSTSSANSAGGGLAGSLNAGHPGTIDVSDNIFWDNTATGGGPQAYLGLYAGTATVSYNDIQGGSSTGLSIGSYGGLFVLGDGNFNLNPLFADEANGDYHLQSRIGRWDPAANGGAGDWVADSADSPCLNAGDPTADYSNEPPPNGNRIDLGAYGNTAEASKTFLSALLNCSWVYQNAPTTTAGRQVCVLTVQAVGDPAGENAYQLDVSQDSSSTGLAVIETTADPLVWNVRGSRSGTDPTGLVTLRVTATGAAHGGTTSVVLQLMVRKLGDVDGDGVVGAKDKSKMNIRIAAGVGGTTGYPERAFDLNGDNRVSAVDKSKMNIIIANGGVAP